MSDDECRVDVKAEDVVGALQALKAARPRGRHISVSFHEGFLAFARGVTTVRVPAVGTWSRTALVSVDLVKELQSMTPTPRQRSIAVWWSRD